MQSANRHCNDISKTGRHTILPCHVVAPTYNSTIGFKGRDGAVFPSADSDHSGQAGWNIALPIIVASPSYDSTVGLQGE